MSDQNLAHSAQALARLPDGAPGAEIVAAAEDAPIEYSDPNEPVPIDIKRAEKFELAAAVVQRIDEMLHVLLSTPTEEAIAEIELCAKHLVDVIQEVLGFLESKRRFLFFRPFLSDTVEELLKLKQRFLTESVDVIKAAHKKLASATTALDKYESFVKKERSRTPWMVSSARLRSTLREHAHAFRTRAIQTFHIRAPRELGEQLALVNQSVAVKSKLGIPIVHDLVTEIRQLGREGAAMLADPDTSFEGVATELLTNLAEKKVQDAATLVRNLRTAIAKVTHQDKHTLHNHKRCNDLFVRSTILLSTLEDAVDRQP